MSKEIFLTDIGTLYEFESSLGPIFQIIYQEPSLYRDKNFPNSSKFEIVASIMVVRIRKRLKASAVASSNRTPNKTKNTKLIRNRIPVRMTALPSCVEKLPNLFL